ncbi:NAD(P)H-binding protein [Kineococcus sp. NUM-3379]
MTPTPARPTTVLVTGATGTVGRPLVARLRSAGHRVRALTRTPATAVPGPGVEVVGGDLTDPASLGRVFEGVGAAHLITFDGATSAPLTRDVVAAAEAAGVRRVTVLRGDVVDGPVESAVRASGLRWTMLAPGEFMAGALEWAEQVRTEGVVREGFADAPSAPVHEADIAAVAAEALTGDGHHGRDLELTGPEVLTVRDRVRILGEVLGRDVRLVEPGRDEVVARWREQGFTEEDVQFFLAMRTDPPEGGRTVRPTVAEVTGRPARPFARWVAENSAAFGVPVGATAP